MRILMISTVPPYPLYYGDRLMVFHLGHALAERGHTVDLLALTQRPDDHAEQRHYAAAFGHIELIDGARHTPAAFVTRLLRPGRHWPSRAEDSWAPGMWRAIERRLDAEHYDVAQLLGGTHVYEFFRALRGVPAVITPADSFGLRARRMFQADGLGVRARLIGRLRWLTARGYERWMYDPFARTVVLSDVDRAELLDGNPALAVDVIPNGVDLREFAAQPTERTRDSLLFVGNFEYGPNADAALALALDLFPRVLERVPGAQLWLVGQRPVGGAPLVCERVDHHHRARAGRPAVPGAGLRLREPAAGRGRDEEQGARGSAMGCPLVASPLSVDGIAVTEGHDAIVAEGDGARCRDGARVAGPGAAPAPVGERPRTD